MAGELHLPPDFADSGYALPSTPASSLVADANCSSDGQAGGQAAGWSALQREGGGGRVLLFVTDASHVAAAADALGRWQPSGECAARREAWGEAERSGGLIRLVPCAPTSLGSGALAAADLFLRDLPAGVSTDVEGVVRCGAQSDGARAGDEEEGIGGGGELSTEGERTAAAQDAAASLLSVAAMIRRGPDGGASSPGGAAAAFQLLLVCVDATDGRTMAAALAARMAGLSVLNVCDVPLSADDGLLLRQPAPASSRPASVSGDGLLAALLNAAAGCV